jgi:hypothetical protein
MAAQALQTSLYSNMPTIPNSPPPKKLSRTFTIFTLAATALGFILVAVGLVQYVNGEVGTPMNMRFDFLRGRFVTRLSGAEGQSARQCRRRNRRF